MLKRILALLLLPCLLCAQRGETLGTWKGFKQINFTIDSTPAYIVVPGHPLAGNPWLWRAYSPDFHTDIDSILVTRGFHLAFLNYKTLFGQPRLMQLWENFYEYLVQAKHFSRLPALEGAVRGSLCEFAWAKRNPDKVSCIYAENPVADIKSWPGGRGKGSGAPAQWKQLLAAYGFSEAQALAYNDNPKDNLAGLAAFKVPLYFSFGLHDSLVPMEENAMMIADQYVKLGGPVTVHPMTRGLQEEKGHHVTIENPAAIADFIYQNAYPVSQALKSESFIHLNGGLKNTIYRIRVNKQASIAFLGGSITAGDGWRNKVCQYLQEVFPETAFTFINAGIPSLGSLPHAFRLENDLPTHERIDLMFIESAVNDHANLTAELTQRRALEGILRHMIRKNPYTEFVMMAFADEDKLAAYHQGKIPTEVNVHEQIAAAYGIPFINLAEEVSRRIDSGEFTWAYDFKNLHPSPFGQEIYFQTIKQMFRQALLSNPPAALIARNLPSPLQKFSFDKGAYVSVSHAQIINGFVVDKRWEAKDSIATRTGFHGVPMLVSENPGSSFSLGFTGNTIGLGVISGPDAGMITYSIDGGKPNTLDLFTQWSPSLHLPWYVLLGDALPARKHTLVVKISPKHNAASKGTACRIVHFLVNQP